MQYVAFLDVLGFKDMVENSCHTKLYNVYKNLFISNAEMALSNGKYKVVEGQDGEVAVADLSEIQVQCLVVSDSVILWANDASMKSFIDICVTAGRLVLAGVYTGLPMRGAISMGELSSISASAGQGNALNVQTVFGLGLVQAYREERRHEWAGIVVEDHCIENYQQQSKAAALESEVADLEYLTKVGLLRCYDVPLKNETLESRWTVNWPKLNRGGVTERAVRESFGRHNKATQDSSVQRKIANTLAYVQESPVT